MLLPLRLRAAATYSAGAMYLGAGCLIRHGVEGCTATGVSRGHARELCMLLLEA